MKAVVQRVASASVAVDGRTVGSCAKGFLVLLGVEKDDGDTDLAWLAGKIHRLRVFPDAAGKMSLALGDVGGQVLVISQFTLLGSVSNGNRPEFTRAAPPDEGRRLYEAFVGHLSGLLGAQVATGIFAADMQVSLINDGPVTILIDSRRRE